MVSRAIKSIRSGIQNCVGSTTLTLPNIILYFLDNNEKQTVPLTVEHRSVRRQPQQSVRNCDIMVDGSFFIAEEQIWHPNSRELVIVERYGSVSFCESQPEVPPCLSNVQIDCVLLKWWIEKNQFAIRWMGYNGKSRIPTWGVANPWYTWYTLYIFQKIQVHKQEAKKKKAKYNTDLRNKRKI